MYGAQTHMMNGGIDHHRMGAGDPTGGNSPMAGGGVPDQRSNTPMANTRGGGGGGGGGIDNGSGQQQQVVSPPGSGGGGGGGGYYARPDDGYMSSPNSGGPPYGPAGGGGGGPNGGGGGYAAGSPDTMEASELGIRHGVAGAGGGTGSGAAGAEVAVPAGAAAGAAAGGGGSDGGGGGGGGGGGPRAPNSTGLIRLTLRKPMGIVFEPMTDPHNPGQQRGVRICDLPRTGAAALSRRLEVGDELLSINDKTMSRLTFDEIMDFIIEADPERVNLLFRRPRKDQLGGVGGAGAAGLAGKAAGTNALGSSDNKVKWVDDHKSSSSKGGKSSSRKDKESSKGKGGSRGGDRDHQDRKSSSRGGNDNNSSKKSPSSPSRRSYRDDDRSEASGGTFETRETLETLETRETRDNKRRGGGGNKRSSKQPRRRKEKEMYGESFLDMLIDSLCAPLVSNDRGGRGRSETEDYDSYDDDDLDDRTFDSRYDDDDTFVTYDSGSVTEVTKETRDTGSIIEEAHKRGGGKSSSSKSGSKSSKSKSSKGSKHNRGDGGGAYTDEEDDEDADTYETNDDLRGSGGKGSHHHHHREVGRTSSKDKSETSGSHGHHSHRTGNKSSASKKSSHHHKSGKNSPPSSPPAIMEAEGGGLDGRGLASGRAPAYEDDATLETVDTVERAAAAMQAGHQRTITPSTPLGLAPIDESKGAHVPIPPLGLGPEALMGMGVQAGIGGEFNNLNLKQDDPSILTRDPNRPISELEYDDRIDHSADVSVMESLGGPSLLIENQRHSAAVAAAGAMAAAANAGGGGAGAAAAAAVPSTPTRTVSADLVDAYGPTYPHDADTIRTHPERFYRHVVRSLLDSNEPEKVRLLDKLLAKYEGREEHLVTKLTVRYEKAKAERAEALEGGGADGALRSTPARNSPNSSPKGSPRISPRGSPKEKDGRGGGEEGFETFGSSFPAGGEEGKEEEFGTEGGAWPPVSSDGSKDASDAKRGGGDGRRGASEEGSSKRGSGSYDPDGSEDGSYSSGSEYSGDSIDGTSPAVIAQVSELLNYVYGKTSVPGQIDRVSTIMRAYEGREAVLLELLETKALIKANAENEAGANLPASLRNSPALAANQQRTVEGTGGGAGGAHPVEQTSSQPDSPMSGLTMNSPHANGDEMSSVSGAEDLNHPTNTAKTAIREANGGIRSPIAGVPSSPSSDGKESKSADGGDGAAATTPSRGKESAQPSTLLRKAAETTEKKKKKGLFGKVFGHSKKKDKKDKSGGSGGAFPSSDGTPKKNKNKLLSPRSNKKGMLLNTVESNEGSI